MIPDALDERLFDPRRFATNDWPTDRTTFTGTSAVTFFAASSNHPW
jgi:hypothetical protein